MSNFDPLQDWSDMLVALSQQEETQSHSQQRPRSALVRYQQRRVAHGRQPGVPYKAGTKRRRNKRNRCCKCRLLGRKNKRIKRVVKRLRSKLNRLDPNQSAANAS